MRHLPALVAAVIAAGTLTGVWVPGHAGAAALVGLAAAGAAAFAQARGNGVAVVAAGLLAVSALSTARGATAFASAAAPSLVAALDAAGVLRDDAPPPRPVVRLAGRLTADAAVEGPVVLLRLGGDAGRRRPVRVSAARGRPRARDRRRRTGADARAAVAGRAVRRGRGHGTDDR